MPVGLSSVNIFRWVAGILAAFWAMAGLADNYVTLAAMGFSLSLIVALLANVALAIGASLAFVNARSWRVVLLAALFCVTADRIVTAVGTDAAGAQFAGAAIACLTIAAVTSIARA
jgi:hypothetical protein